MIKVVIVGDKSRYQFWRSIVDFSDIRNEDFFYTEQLSEKELCVTSNKNKSEYFFSSIVPLNTTLCFPVDISANDHLDENERIVVFNEFPYAREEDLNRIRKYIELGKKGQLLVVFVDNNRKGMKTDVSSSDLAIKVAEEAMQELGVHYCRYKIGEKPYFLFYRLLNQDDEKQTFYPYILEVKRRIDVFDSEYDCLYELDLELLVNNPTVKKNLLRYEKNIVNKNVWDVYARRVEHFFLHNNADIRTFYGRMYKESISPVVLWDINSDLENLDKEISLSLIRYFMRNDPLCFVGSVDKYDCFLRDNSIIFLFGKMVNSFFKEELKILIKNRVLKNLKIMEGLLDEGCH